MTKQMNIWEFIERNKPFIRGTGRDFARLVIVGGIFLMNADSFDADEIKNLLYIGAGLLGMRGVETYRETTKNNK